MPINQYAAHWRREHERDPESRRERACGQKTTEVVDSDKKDSERSDRQSQAAEHRKQPQSKNPGLMKVSEGAAHLVVDPSTEDRESLDFIAQREIPSPRVRTKGDENVELRRVIHVDFVALAHAHVPAKDVWMGAQYRSVGRVVEPAAGGR